MTWMSALSDQDMNEDQKKAFERAKSKIGIEGEAPAWLRVLANSPEYLKDVYMNLDKAVFADGNLSAKMKTLLALVSASRAGNTAMCEFFAERAKAAGYDDAQIYEAVGISATSTSFNYYYKFRSLSGGSDFEGYNPGLRASLFLRPSLGKAFAELVNMTTSTVNGCPSCVSGHIASAAQHDVSKAQIDEAIRVNAIVQSICSFLSSSPHLS